MKLQYSWKRLAAGSMAILAVALMVTAITHAQAPQNDRYIHVKVDGLDGKTEAVSVCLPLNLAAVIVSSVNNNQVSHGHLRLGQTEINGVDVRSILDAVRSSPDGQVITMKSHNKDIQVSKLKGQLIIRSTDDESADHHAIEARVPIAVVDAMLNAGGGQEINLGAGLRALATLGDTELITYKDSHQNMHIWLNSSSAAE
jgi:hypothetical protein